MTVTNTILTFSPSAPRKLDAFAAAGMGAAP